MKTPLKPLFLAGVLPLVTACVPVTPEGESVALSEDVQRIVAPGQDLTNVRVQSDGCYWYLHSGPVEDTYIPLRTRDGRDICTRGQGIPISEL